MLLLCLGLFALIIGCSEPDSQPAAPQVDLEVQSQEARAAEARETARQYLVDNFEEALEQWLDHRLGEHPLEKLLTIEEAPLTLQRRLFMATLYHERDWRPLFVKRGTLTALGSAVVARLQDAPSHALRAERYWNDEHRANLDLLDEWAFGWQERPSLQLSREERLVVAALVDEVPLAEPEEMMFSVLEMAVDVEDVESAPIPDLAQIVELRFELHRGLRAHEAVFEAKLMDTLFLYAFDQRHGNVAMFGSSVSEEERLRVVAERLTELFQGLEAAAEQGGQQVADELMQTLEPPHPQYRPLLAERQRYLDIVEAGGWPTVRRFNASRGQRTPRIPALRERLEIEGYLEPPAEGESRSEVFDAELERALVDYQTTHQMAANGELYTMFWSSLNVSAEQRLAQIELTIQRWRESRIGDDDYYIFVNVPDFHGEVWRNGNRDLRFRVIIGNNRVVCNPRTGTLELPDATPLHSFTMTYMVLNPYWNVPRRLLRDQLLPQLLEDETFFDQMGYERHITDAGTEIVRQRPGPLNALGRVKFMFPNQHSVYMHDTPSKNLFNNPIRAYSAGCVRVQEPMDLMQYLLENDNQWDPARIDRLFEAGEETSVILRESVPVHFEYYVVRVDDEGRANFLSDVYRYDRNRMNTPDPEALACAPPEQPSMTLVLGEDGRVMMRDSDGELYDPEELRERELEQEDIVDGEGPPPGDVGP